MAYLFSGPSTTLSAPLDNILILSWVTFWKNLCVCVCVVVVWRKPGPGLTSVRVQVPSCWMRWNAQETSCSWISVLMATGSSTTVTTWRMLGSPAALIQVHAPKHTHTYTQSHIAIIHTDELKAAIYSRWAPNINKSLLHRAATSCLWQVGTGFMWAEQ